MRTTVTLDDDVYGQVKEVARLKKVTFTAALNDAVRAGLAAAEIPTRPYKLQTRSMGLRPGIDLTKALQLADELEDEEIIRKLRFGK